MATSLGRSDDTIPASYKYSWSPCAPFSIEEFAAKYKPSMVQNDGTKPWIWVRPKQGTRLSSVENEAAAILEAAALLQEVTGRVEQIKNDVSIPVHASKKAGMQSKKEICEQVQAEAANNLKDVSKKYGFVCGKWLVFAPSDKVDMIWSKIALSLASGPLSTTSAFCAKVSTSPQNNVPGYQHVICIYIPDVYDMKDVTVVMKVLLRQHGLNVSGVKSDLYTIIGLDSKHPSGIPSTVWKKTSLLKNAEMKELKEAYYAEQLALEAERTVTTTSTKNLELGKEKSRILVKKKVADDFFASDDERQIERMES